MWADDVRGRYWWIKIRNQMEELFCELCKAENEEQTDLYLLRLHLDNEPELKFFTPKERKKIEKLFSILIQDTVRHNDLLAQLTQRLEEERKHDVRKATQGTLGNAIYEDSRRRTGSFSFLSAAPQKKWGAA